MGNLPNNLARFVAITVVCASAWPLGSVAPEHQFWMAQAITLCVLLSIFTRESLHITRTAISSVLLLLTLALSIGWIQIQPLPSSLVNSVTSAAHQQQVVEELSAEASATKTISIYPTATRRDLSLLALGFALAFVGMTQFQTAGAQFALCAALATNGAALAAWGIFQKLSKHPELIPGVPIPEHGVVFSTYVNHSSAAGYITMGLAAGLGLLLYSWRNADVGETKLQDGLRRWLEFVATPSTVAAMLLSSVCALGIVLSMSRGAFVALCVAAAGTTMLLFFTRKKMASPVLIGVIFFCVIGLIGWLGFSDQVTQRLATLNVRESADNTRVAHWRDGFRTAQQFPVLGSGLGTYRYAYLLNDTGDFDVWYRHAHNQYLEAAVDAGLPGLTILVLLVVVAGISGLQIRLQKSAILHHWFAAAGFFLLLSQAVHALADFGLYHPANMAAAALFCGSLCGTAALFAARRWQVLLRMPRVFSYPLLWGALSFTLCLFAARELRAWKTADAVVYANRDYSTVEEFDAAIQNAHAAIVVEPDDAELHLTLASLWIARYRLETAAALQAADDLDELRIREVVSLRNIHNRLWNTADEQRDALRRELVALPHVRANLQPAWQSLHTATKLCPYIPSAHINIALLSPLFDQDELPALRTAEQLAYSSLESNYDLGRVHLQARRYDDMLRVWQRSLALGRDREASIFQLARSVVGPAAIATQLMPNDPGYHMDVALRLSNRTSDRQLRARLAERALELIPDSKSLEPEQYQLRCAAHLLLSDYVAAQSAMHSAVTARPNNLEWRYQFAALLVRNGEFNMAKEHITWCLRLQPDTARFQQLLKRIDDALTTTALR